MSVKVVQQVVAEVTADTTKLDAGLKDAEAKTQRTKKQIEGTGAAAGRLGNQYAGAARQIASATETIARSGNVTGETAKQILSAGSSIAFAFGPTGAAVGALSIFALAVATAMRNSREELEQTAKKGEETISRLLNAGDIEGLKRDARVLFTGTPGFKKDGERAAFQDGIAARRREIARLEAELEATTNPFNVLQRNVLQRKAEIDRLRAELAPLEKLFQETAEAIFTFERAVADGTAAAFTVTAAAFTVTAESAASASKELTQFGAEFENLVLQELGTAVDQVTARFDALIAKGTSAEGADSPRVKQLIALRDTAVEAARAIADSQATLREIDGTLAAGGQPTAATFQELTQRTDELRAQLSRLKPETRAYLAVQQQLRDVERERAKLLEKIGNSGGGSGKNPADRSTADLAREIQQAVDGALQLAAAFGAVDAQATNVLRSVAQIAGNIPALQTALTSGSGLGILSASLPIAGAIASLIGDSPAEAARREELRRNTDAIRELTEKAGLLGGDVAGRDAAAAQSVLQDFLSRRAGNQILGRNEAYNATNQATIAAESLGILPQLQKIAAQYGITLNRNITSFEQLAAVLADTITKLGEFGTDLDSALQQANAEAEIFGITDPLRRLGLTTGALAGRSPAFDQLTAGLDLSTAEGREQARKNAQALFEVLKAGGGTLSAGQLGGLTGQQLLDAILALVNGLNDIDESQGTNTSTATQADQVVTADRTQITADQASRLLGLASSQLAELRLIRSVLEASVTPIALPSAAVFGAGAPAGTVIQSITIEINNLGSVTGAELGTQLSDALIDALNRALGQRVTIARLNAGKAVLS